MKALKDIMPTILGLITIAAIFLSTGRILEKLENLVPRVVQLEETVFGYHK